MTTAFSMIVIYNDGKGSLLLYKAGAAEIAAP